MWEDILDPTEYFKITENSWKCWYHGNKTKLKNFWSTSFRQKILHWVSYFLHLWHELPFDNVNFDLLISSGIRAIKIWMVIGQLFKRREKLNILHSNIIDFQLLSFLRRGLFLGHHLHFLKFLTFNIRAIKMIRKAWIKGKSRLSLKVEKFSSPATHKAVFWRLEASTKRMLISEVEMAGKKETFKNLLWGARHWAWPFLKKHHISSSWQCCQVNNSSLSAGRSGACL